MAEFQEVMKHRRRMCSQFDDCVDCPLREFRIKHTKQLFCDTLLETSPADVERIVMKWVSEHPEPVYPTWFEWWNENFNSEGRRMLSPCSFMPPRDLGCSPGHDGCMVAPYKCWHTRIPAEVAQKLGIKPIDEK